MTAKDLLKWKIEELPGTFTSPLQPLLGQLQSQLQAGQFPDALRSLHDAFVFLTMLYGGISVGSLRSVTPLGPDLTLLLDEPLSPDLWSRLLRQSWQDWSRHPHHPALDAIRHVFFLSSRLQSSRFGPRRHSRWLGLGSAASNGETFSSWAETIRRAKNINPEAAARQLLMKLPLLNIWLRASQEFLTNWTLRLDPKHNEGLFRYLVSRDDCRFETLPLLSPKPLLLRVSMAADGTFQVSPNLTEGPATQVSAQATPATPATTPVAVATTSGTSITGTPVTSAPPKPTTPEEKPKGDVGLQWDPATKTYRLVATPKPPQPEPAKPTPVAAPEPEPAKPTPVAATQPEPAKPTPVAATQPEPAKPTPVAATQPEPAKPTPVTATQPEPAKPTPVAATQPEPAKPTPIESEPPTDDIDAMLKAELQSLEDLLADDSLAEIEKPLAQAKPGLQDPFESLGDLSLDFLAGDVSPSKPKLGPPPPIEESLEDLLSEQPSLEDLLAEPQVPTPQPTQASEPDLDDLLAQEEAVAPEPSQTGLPGEVPPLLPVASEEPSLEDLLGEEPSEPSLDDLLAESESLEESLLPVPPLTTEPVPVPATVDTFQPATSLQPQEVPPLGMVAESTPSLPPEPVVVVVAPPEPEPVAPPPPPEPVVVVAPPEPEPVAPPPPPEPVVVVAAPPEPEPVAPPPPPEPVVVAAPPEPEHVAPPPPPEPVVVAAPPEPEPIAPPPPPEPVVVVAPPEPEPVAPPPPPEPVVVAEPPEPEPVAPPPPPEPVVVVAPPEPEPVAPPPPPEPVVVAAPPEPEPVAPPPPPEPVVVAAPPEPEPVAPPPPPEPVVVAAPPEPEPVAPPPPPEPVVVVAAPPEPEPVAPPPPPEPVVVAAPPEPEHVAPPPPPEPVVVAAPPEPEPVAPPPPPEPVVVAAPPEPEPVAPPPPPEPVVVVAPPEPEPVAPPPPPEPVVVVAAPPEPEPVAPPPPPEPVVVVAPPEPEPVAPPPPPEPVVVAAPPEPEPVAPPPPPEPVVVVAAPPEPEPVAPPPPPEPVVVAAPPEPEHVAPPPPPEPVVVAAPPEPEPVAPPPPPEPVVVAAPPEPEPVAPPPPPEPVVVVAPPEPEPVAPPPPPEPVVVVAAPPEPEPVAPPPPPEPVVVVAPPEPEPVAPPPPPEPVVVAAPPEPEPVVVVAPPEPAIATAPTETEPIAPPPPPEPAVVVAPPEPEPIAPPPPPEPVVVVAPPEPEPIAPPPPPPEPVVVVAPPEPEPIAPPPPPEPAVVVAPPEPEPVAPPPPPEPAVVVAAPEPEPIAPPPPPEPAIALAPPEPEPIAPPPPPEPAIALAPPEPEPIAPPPPPEPVAVVAPPEPAIATAPPEPEPIAPPPPIEPVVAAVVANVTKPHEPAVTVIHVEEEIEEYDSYQFDLNSGPPAPPWESWTAAQRSSLDDVTQALQERQAHMDFTYLLGPVRNFINKDHKGYLLLDGESGVGKSYFGFWLESIAPQVHPRGIRVAYLKVSRRPFGDYETFIETINDQLAQSNAPRTHRIQPLDRNALHDLAVQFPSPKRKERWGGFVSNLAIHNRGPILLYLDEIDRRHLNDEQKVSPVDFLPESLPDNVYLIISYKPDAAEDFLQKIARLQDSTRLTLEPVAADYRKQLESELNKIGAIQGQETVLHNLLQSCEFRLHYARLSGQAWASHLLSPTGQTPISNLYSEFADHLRKHRPERYASIQHFIMTLCATFEPVSWDDLDQWGTSVETIQEVVDLIPATLLQQKLGMFLCVDIAHESLRDFLINHNKEAFAAVCRILTGWMVHTIQAAGELKLQSEQGREWARLSFFRLYRWSLLCQDVTVLEWVVRNKELQKKRIAVAQALEASARTHQKLGLLDLWVEALRILVEEHQKDDLRDELAWALNSRGLTYLTLNRRLRALEDLDLSVKRFEVLVNQERKTQFRNGLAAAYNRRSEIHFALHNLDNALEDSAQAVQLFTDLVEDMGREDLLPQLAFAHRNQSSVWSAKSNNDEATRCMESAIKIFARLAEGPEEGRYSRDQAACHLQMAQQRLKSKQYNEAQLEAGKAVTMLANLSERDPANDVRNLLERAHYVRGCSYLELDQPEKALRDLTKSVTLNNQLVDEGRLDQRDELAQAHSMRSRAQTQSKQPKEAIRDLTKSIEIRQKLIQEGREDQCGEVAQEYIQRAETYRSDKQEENCQNDLSSAQQILLEEQQKGRDVGALLLKIHCQKASLGMQLGRYQEVILDADQALKLIQKSLAPDAQKMAQLYALRGEGYRRQLLYSQARSDFDEAIKIYTDLIKNQGDTALLIHLAETYGSLARVSLSMNRLDQAHKEVNRSVEALEVTSSSAPASLAQAYSTRAEVLERMGQHQAARHELTETLKLYSKLVDGEGQAHLLDEQALAFRRLGRTLLSLNEPNPARDALEQATRRYKELWSKDRKGPWLDELSRTQVVNSAVSVVLKEYGAAEEEIQRTLEHFQGLLNQGRVEYFDDVFQTSIQRARNFIRVGMHAKASDELARTLELLKKTAALHEKVDFREHLSRVLRLKAGVAASQQSFEQAYNDYETAIQTLQPLVVEENQFHLGKDLADMYRERARMLLAAGHAQPGLADLSQAVQVLTVLLSQGREELRRPLAQVAQERATAYLTQSELVAAVEDLNLGIELLMSLAGKSDDPDMFAELAHMLSQRGRCFQQAQQSQHAASDFERAVQLYSSLVETHGRNDLSSILAECLLSHLSLSGQSVEDPARLQALVKAVRLVTQQTKEGKPPEESFVIDAVSAVLNTLRARPDQANSELVESVIKLTEAILQVPRLSVNWVNLTELLSQCYQALEANRGPKYVSFICLSCVSCGREVGTVGAASMPRLIYFLSLLGVTLSTDRPGEQLSLVGNAFTALLEQLARQRLDEQQAMGLRQLVTTWQQLPAGYPAAANVSRGVLTNLLRAT